MCLLHPFLLSSVASEATCWDGGNSTCKGPRSMGYKIEMSPHWPQILHESEVNYFANPLRFQDFFVTTHSLCYSYLILNSKSFHSKAWLFVLLHFTDIVFFTNLSQDSTRKKDDDLFYCDTHLIVVVWKQTCNISEVSVGMSAESGVYLVMKILDVSLFVEWNL